MVLTQRTYMQNNELNNRVRHKFMELEQSEFQQGNKKMLGGKTVSSRSVVG